MICEHPLSDITIAGQAVRPLQDTFHMFLQSVSDVMMYLPPGSALQVCLSLSLSLSLCVCVCGKTWQTFANIKLDQNNFIFAPNFSFLLEYFQCTFNDNLFSSKWLCGVGA